MKELTSRVVSRAAVQFEALDSRLQPGSTPRSVKDGKPWDEGIGWWCSGFFPGSCWYLYELSGNGAFRSIAERNTLQLSGLCDQNTDHDIGFQINCSYGNAYRITGDESYLPVMRAAAEKLSGRFSPVTGTIRSWDWGDWSYPVIIDNMMNLELLMKAAELFGDVSFSKVAVSHANTTMANHFRSDHSSWHLVDYDERTGKVLGRQTVQGYSDESVWTRGQAWGLYGYTAMYRFTHDKAYLDLATDIAELLIAALPFDGIPYWDNSVPQDGEEFVLRDVSAAAIMSSALLELSGYVSPAESARYVAVAERQIRTMASDGYLAKEGENSGFLLMHGVGHVPNNSEVDAPLTYADYYFIEALVRFSRLDDSATREHPKLFLKADTFETISQRLARGDRTVTLLHGEVMREADDALESQPIERIFDASGRRILQQSRRAIKNISSCAYAYRMTGDARYSRRAISDMEQVCAFESWNPSHFLDVGEMATAIAIGYDWLYDVLTPSQRQMFESSVLEKAVKLGLEPQGFYMNANNWNQVCTGGMVMAALSVLGPENEWTQKLLDYAMEYNRNCMELMYYPDGIYSEGPVYWEYGTMYELMMIDAMESFLGHDSGLYATAGLERSADFIRFSVGSTGLLFNFSDNVSNPKGSVPLWFFASRKDDASLLRWDRMLLERGEIRTTENERFLPLLAVLASRMDFDDAPADNRDFFCGDGVNPVFMVHTDWTYSPSDKYLAVKGGTADTTHAHMDAGEFVFDAFGYRWAQDPDRENYAMWENICKEAGGDLWALGQESLRWKIRRYNNTMHNTLTINGKDHCVKGKATLAGTFAGGHAKGGVLDMTGLFGEDVKAAYRTVCLVDDGYLEVTDSIVANDTAPAHLRWTLNTPAKVKVRRSGIDLVQGKVTMHLAAEGEKVKYTKWSTDPSDYDYVFSAREAKPENMNLCGYEKTIAPGQTCVIKTTIKRKK